MKDYFAHPSNRGYGMLGGTAQSGVGQVLFGTVAGGVTSRLQGGNFWEGAAIGLVVSGLNHAMHPIDSDNVEYDQQGRKVTKESLGIKKGDDRETMIDKTLKGMKVGDYISGEEASFLGDESAKYINTITRTGKTTFKVDGKSNWGISAFKDGAIISISPINGIPIKGASGGSFKITIKGLSFMATKGGASSTSYTEGNKSYTLENKRYWEILK